MLANSTLFLIMLSVFNVEIPDGDTIITNSIEFHDPNNNWQNLQAHLGFIETRPNKENRITSIEIDNKRGNFCTKREVNKMHVQRHIEADSCFFNIDEYEELTDKEIEDYKLNDEQSFFLRNYYLYLWGLPMKLNDEGTHVDKTTKLTYFDNKEVYEVKVWYEEKTGSDTWFFYFNPKNYALLGYRFYHSLEKGDGEYILLKDQELVFGMQIPKSRSWYTNKDSTFLGTDILTSFDVLEHSHY
jgi:uncharacterized protein DUF6503